MSKYRELKEKARQKAERSGKTYQFEHNEYAIVNY